MQHHRKHRDDLLSIPEISSAEIQGEKKYQIDVEIPQRTLREYGLTLTEVARRIRAQNVELPGGSIKDASQEYLLRGKNKRVNGEEIAEIPLVTSPTGVVLTVGDLANVKDEFGDLTSISRINGNPGMAISISAAAQEDMLAMTAAVRKYIAEKKLPPGYSFVTWEDRSIEVQDRLNLLVKNGLQGLVLVFVVLALFLDLRLSFWVALGIPVSLLGACAVLWQTGDTLNMLSMFSFLIALGIVVDDAIVVGENIYAHREAGKGGLKAAIHGTAEVVPSVVASVTTTVFAFMPMFFVSGVMGKFFAVMQRTGGDRDPHHFIVRECVHPSLPLASASEKADIRPLRGPMEWRNGARTRLRFSCSGPSGRSSSSSRFCWSLCGDL
ncbi:MAG: efflux RND transporter permease subunit [Planctomycetaceae bacterium]